MVKKKVKPVKPVKVFGRERAVKEEKPVEVETPSAIPAGADILPPSLKAVLRAGTELRRRNRLPDDLEERTAAMVRRFKGDRPR